MKGPSPRAREAAASAVAVLDVGGSIPASVGNSLGRTARQMLRRVYPYGRGEQSGCQNIFMVAVGPSPRAGG